MRRNIKLLEIFDLRTHIILRRRNTEEIRNVPIINFVVVGKNYFFLLHSVRFRGKTIKLFIYPILLFINEVTEEKI